VEAPANSGGRLLLAYLALNRFRRIDREELLTAVYAEEATPRPSPRLSVLFSKLRHVGGPELLVGRSDSKLVLPPDAFVDVEAALEALHRAESHVANCEWAEAWGRVGVGYYGPAGPCSKVTTARGWTSGGDAWTTARARFPLSVNAMAHSAPPLAPASDETSGLVVAARRLHPPVNPGARRATDP
jgi:hypothetical protein